MKILFCFLIFLILSATLATAYRVQFHSNVQNREYLTSALENYNLSRISAVQFVNQKNSWAALFIVGGSKGHVLLINTFFVDYSDLQLDFLIGHELKHLRCWESEKYLGHKGCFLKNN